MCLLFVPVCCDSNTLQRESCVPWQESRCPNKTGETGGKWRAVLHAAGPLRALAWSYKVVSCDSSVTPWQRYSVFLIHPFLHASGLHCYFFSPHPLFAHRRQNGENKPLTVPKDIDLHLEKAPVNVIDALGKTNTSSSTSVMLCKSKYYSKPSFDC